MAGLLDVFTIGFNSEGLKDFETNLKNTEKELDKTEQEIKDLKQKFDDLSTSERVNITELNNTEKALTAAEEKSEKLKKTLNNMKSSGTYSALELRKQFTNLVKTLGLLAIAGTAIKKSIDFYEQGEQLGNLAERAGVAVDKFQELSNAAKRFGGSIEDTAATLENLRTARLDIAAGGNGGGLKETAVKQGITISDDPEQTLENIARKMETLQTEAQKLDLAKSMGIDEGTARLLSQGVERYREELQRAKKYQLFTKEDIERMREYRQVQSDIRLGLQNIFGSIWRMLLPAITQVAKVIRSVTDWLAEHEGAVKIIATITAVIIAVAGLAAAVQLLNAAFALVAANPVVLTILAIAAAIGLCIVAINDFIVFMQGGDSVIGRILEKWGYDTDLIRQDLNKLGADIKAWFATWLDGWRIIGEWIDSTRAKLKAFWDSLPEPLKKMITGGIKTALLLNPSTAIPAAGVMAGQKFMERYKKNDLNAVSQSAISTSYQTQAVNNNAKNNAQSIINNDNSNIRKISGSTNSKRVNIQKVEINTQASDPQAIANLININAMSNLDNGMRG